MKKKIEKVSVVKCGSYEQSKVDKAIVKALKLIEFDVKNGSKVLLKPNIVMLGEDKNKNLAAITHLNIIESVCRFLKAKGCKIYIGESSFMSTDIFLKQAGIDKLAKKYCVNKKPIIFEQEKLIYINDNNAEILKKFPVAKILKEVDYVVNMPKMKTHILTNATLGIKNLYGLIPGGLKQRIHNKAKGKKFSQILVDIYQNFPSELTIMDGIIGMEGQGPTAGNPKKAGVILASKNTVALDIVASRIMDFKPNKIPATKFAIKRKLYSGYKVDIVGVDKLPRIHFRRPMLSNVSSKVKALLKERPIVCDTTKCTKCGICAEHCPVKAITLKPYPVIDKKKCIRCFCCMEVCPQHALSLGK